MRGTLSQKTAIKLSKENGWTQARGGKHQVKMTKEGCRPELSGCFASGDTLDELFESLREGIALYLGAEPASEMRIERHTIHAPLASPPNPS